MQAAPLRPDEAVTQAALQALAVLDSEPEAEFDALVRAASLVCEMPIALVSLVDSKRQWFKANLGLEGVSETPRDVAFCAHVVLGDELLEVPDAARDSRFADNPLVTGAPGLRFYAGAPIVLESGGRVGVVCVMDRQPRRLTNSQREILMCLARSAASALEGRRAILALRASEERLRVLYESTPAMLHSIDPQGRLVSVSDAWLDRLGYLREEVIGRQSNEFLAPASSAHARGAVMPAFFASGRADNIEYEIVAKNGEIVDVLISAILERDADGKPLRSLAVLQDITARKRAERQLAEKRQRLDNIIEGTQAGTWEQDLILGATRVNATYSTMLGHPAEGSNVLTSDSVMALIHPDDRIRVSEARQAHLSGLTAHFESEFRMRHKDGQWVWVLSRGKVIDRDEQGRPLTMSGIHLDISHQVMMRQAATRARHDLQSILDAVPSMIGYWDQNLVNRFANHAYHEWFGVQGGSLPGKHMASLLGEELFRKNLPHAQRALAGQAQQFERDIQVPGSTRVRHSLARYQPDVRDGKVVGFYALVFDVTELKQAQALLQERTALAESANVAKSAFLVNMSHELRTPMNAILGMLALLQKTALTPRQGDYVAKSDSAARSLLGLLNGILDFSKVESGKLVLDPHPFRLGRVMGELGDILTANLGGKSIALRFEIDSQVPEYLVGDSTRLQQILVNLGGNAIKFTAQGEVVVSVSVVGPVESVVTLEFVVRDTGIGISRENQDRIFSAFTQAEASITRRFGGTGLGLAISRQLVALMGSELSVSSGAGQGSQFCFRLAVPVAHAGVMAAERDRTAASRETTPRGSARLNGTHVLLVEDNPTNQQVATELLESEGATVQCAGNGQEAVDAVAASPTPFSVILMDLQMPVMDGLSATRRILEVHGPRAPAIVAMTANAMASDRQDCLNAGMVEHVGKPFDIDDLVRTLLACTRPSIASAAADAQVDYGATLERLGGKSAIYANVMGSFLKSLPRMMRELREHHAQADRVSALRLLHTLKGLAATVGATALAASARQAEQDLAICGNAELGLAVVEQVCNAVTQASPALAMLSRAMHAAQGARAPLATIDAVALQPALRSLVPLLRDSDMAALDAMEAVMRCAGVPVDERLLRLEAAVKALDFDAALALCDALSPDASLAHQNA